MTSRRLRHLGILFLPILTPAIAWVTLVQRTIPSATAQPILLVCGDFSDQGSFVHAVFEEARRVSKDPQVRSLARFRVERLDDAGDSASAQFEQSFLDALARNYIVCIISANTSQSTPPVIRLAETFRIPVLVTVATTKAALAHSRGYTLRLVGDDSKQATVIGEWAGKHQYKRITVMYHQSEYGEFLSRTLLSNLEAEHKQALRVSFANTPAAGQGLRALKNCPLDALVYVGYRQDLPDLLRWLDVHELRFPLLVTDGCFSQDLGALAKSRNFVLSLSFPVDPFPERSGRQPGFGAYGNDAAYILAYALNDALDKGVTREKLMASIRQVVNDRSIDDKLLNCRYRFSDSGENEEARFRFIDDVNKPPSEGGANGNR